MSKTHLSAGITRQVEEARTGSIVSLDPYVWLFFIKNFVWILLYDSIHMFVSLFVYQKL